MSARCRSCGGTVPVSGVHTCGGLNPVIGDLRARVKALEADNARLASEVDALGRGYRSRGRRITAIEAERDFLRERADSDVVFFSDDQSKRLAAEVKRLREILRRNGYIVDHAFRADPDYPDDGACMVVTCDAMEEDHLDSSTPEPTKETE